MPTLLSKFLLSEQATPVTGFIDVDEGSDSVLVPTIYVVSPDGSTTNDQDSEYPCKYKSKRHPSNCIAHIIDSAAKNNETETLEKYEPTFDNRKLRCANPKCGGGDTVDTDFPTGNTFHFGCYAHMIRNNENKHHIVKKEYDQRNLLVLKQTICFPVCSPGCWRSVNSVTRQHMNRFVKEEERLTSMRMAVEMDDPELLPRWDDDWIVRDGPTSMSHLLHWLSIEENGSAYLGAKDSTTGNTRGTTKDMYHVMIANYIRSQSGKSNESYK